MTTITVEIALVMKGKIMKKIIAALTALTLASAGAHNAAAGDREWATAGKVLTGLLAAKVISQAFEPAPVYSQTTVYTTTPVVVAQPPPPVQTVVVQQPAATVYYQTPVYVQPAPVVFYQAPACVPTASVVYQTAPVYYAPPPVVSLQFGFRSSSFYHRPHFHGRW